MAPPLDPSTILELIERRARERPEAVAITSLDGSEVTYEALRTRVHTVAHGLAALGCAPGTRVAVVLPNGPETAVVDLALASLVPCVPLNPAYTEEELRGLLERLRVSLVVTTAEHAAARSAARALGLPALEASLTPLDGTSLGPPIAPEDLLAPAGEDLALVLHTSGSTAEPKIVPLTHRNLLHSARSVARSLELGAGDVCLSALPLFHVGALVDLLLAPLSAGGRVVVATGMGASEIFAHLEESGPTWYQGVPTMLQDILHRAELDGRRTTGTGLRLIRSVSAPLPPAMMRALEERFGVPVVEIYGMTETAGVITSNPLPPGERRAGSVGVSAGPEVVVFDSAGNPAPPGRAGEVLVRGPSVMEGYEGLPAGENDHFVGDWLRTGDEGYLDADGYLYLTGRIKDIINRGGEKIAPRELDEVALSHPDVHDAAAFAVPHETLGEAVALAVVPVPGRTLDPSALRAFCAERVARFKVPQDVHVVDTLPRAPGGKLQRSRLAERCAGGGEVEAPHPSGPAPAENERQRALVEVWQDTFGIAPVGIHDDFIDLGGDSLRAVELTVRVSERLGLEIPTAAVYDHPTIAELEVRLTSFGPLTSGDEGRSADHESAMLGEVRELVGTWRGRRASDDSLLVGWNTLGARPPFFWGVQGFGDLRVLAEALGPDQPVWGMRSLYETRSKSPENIVRLAGRYRREIERIQPEGPVSLGGYCAGGRVAFEIARQLADAGREVATLCLVEHFQPEPYAGRVAYFFGVESGWHPFRTADPSWSRYCTGHVTLHPSRAVHVDILMDREMIAALGRELLAAGRAYPTPPVPGAVDVEVDVRLPSVWVSRSEERVEITVENRGQAAVPAGTTLFGRWGRPRSGRVFFDRSVTLDEELATGARTTVALDVRAPLAPGPWSFRVDVVGGGDWSSGAVTTPFRRLVTVLPGPAVWSYLRERLPGPPDWSVALRRLTGRTA